MLKQIRRILPFVRFELPCLSSREDRDDALPVVGLELLGGIDENETKGTVWVDAEYRTGDVQDVGCGARGARKGAVGGDIGTGLKERLYV